MATIDISYLSLGIGLLLLLIPIYYIWYYETKLLKSICVGAVRMVIQMIFIGVYLRYLFEWNNPVVNCLWVFIMVFIAAETALTRWKKTPSALPRPRTAAFWIAMH